MYANRHTVTGVPPFTDGHWLNFSWGEEFNPSLNRSVLVLHPNKVWMQHAYCPLELWSTVKLRKERAVDK